MVNLKFVKLGSLLCIVASSLFTMCGQLGAAELSKMDVQRKGARFYMDSILLVDAPLETMYAVLTDYNSLHQFSRGIVHSQEVTPDIDGTPRVYTHIRGCVAFFCRSVERVERVETIVNKKIVMTLDPKASKNVAWNLSTWELERVTVNVLDEKGETKQLTKIHYSMEFEPKFWVPPLLGGYMVKKSLAKDGVEIMTRMEAYAQGKYMLDPKKNKRLNFPQLDLQHSDFVDMKNSEDQLLQDDDSEPVLH